MMCDCIRATRSHDHGKPAASPAPLQRPPPTLRPRTQRAAPRVNFAEERHMASTTERLGLATAPSVASQYTLKIPIRARYENWISGEYTAPVRGQYFSNPSPITGQHLC